MPRGHPTYSPEFRRQTVELVRVGRSPEGCLSQGMCVCGLRRSRYVGLAKTHLQHVATAAALNVVRFSAWVQGEARAATRTSRLTRFMAA